MKKKKKKTLPLSLLGVNITLIVFCLTFYSLLGKEPQLDDLIFRNPHNLEGFLYKLGIGWHEPLSQPLGQTGLPLRLAFALGHSQVGSGPGVPNLWSLMPDDLRWS